MIEEALEKSYTFEQPIAIVSSTRLAAGNFEGGFIRFTKKCIELQF